MEKTGCLLAASVCDYGVLTMKIVAGVISPGFWLGQIYNNPSLAPTDSGLEERGAQDI